MGELGKTKGRPSVAGSPFSSVILDMYGRLKRSGFNQQHLYVEPNVRLTPAVAADGMTFRFAFTFSHDMGR
jgi:hypothetical protein